LTLLGKFLPTHPIVWNPYQYYRFIELQGFVAKQYNDAIDHHFRRKYTKIDATTSNYILNHVIEPMKEIYTKCS
jgi:hypothetical protein